MHLPHTRNTYYGTKCPSWACAHCGHPCVHTAVRQALCVFHHHLPDSHSNDLQEFCPITTIVTSGTDYFTTLLRVYRYLREMIDTFNIISIINVEDYIKREDPELSRACNIVTNMRYGNDLWYSGATQGGKPCGWGVLVMSTGKKRAVVLRGTFSPYKGPFIPHASLPILVERRSF